MKIKLERVNVPRMVGASERRATCKDTYTFQPLALICKARSGPHALGRAFLFYPMDLFQKCAGRVIVKPTQRQHR